LTSTDLDPAVSNLTEVEFFSAIAKKSRRGEFDTLRARKLRLAFLSHLESFLFERLPVQTAHYQLARSWLSNEKLALATLDALHVAVASISGCTLLTADTKQARAAEELGVEVKLLG